MPERELQRLRERIDAIDEKLLDLISERARLAGEVARAKQAAGNNSSCYRPEREAQVLRRMLEHNPGPLPDEDVARLFREIMSACLALQQPLTIAYLGPEGTFTQAAAFKHFGHSVNTAPLAAIDEVFREVESGDAHFGVVPVENSTEGVVTHTLDQFMESPLKICGEVVLRIHHHLLGRGDGLDGVKKVYAHQQALAQCRRWLDGHLPHADRLAVSSNAEAARLASKEDESAAIAGDAALELYGLRYLARNIEDEPDNTTRFLVIGRQDTPRSGRDKTSLMFTTPNRAGALYEMLSAFAEQRISLTRIESRPSRIGMWDYVFFVDLEGHIEDEPVREAVTELERRAAMVKHLGSYPQAVL
ncbi:MAG: prephenate dehydratase [Gammaproteobacteria bacterium]|nr:MAG: prephenate dehydratase [Gammaproteobacteria bacterium]